MSWRYNWSSFVRFGGWFSYPLYAVLEKFSVCFCHLLFFNIVFSSCRIWLLWRCKGWLFSHMWRLYCATALIESKPVLCSFFIFYSFYLFFFNEDVQELLYFFNSNSDRSSAQVPMQITASNGMASVNNSLTTASTTTSASTIVGLLHQNSMNNASSPYGGNSVQIQSPGYSTLTTISWFILCRSKISWFVSATSTMIVSFVVFFLLYFDLFVLMQV
jgi:hypothetical protein